MEKIRKIKAELKKISDKWKEGDDIWAGDGILVDPEQDNRVEDQMKNYKSDPLDLLIMQFISDCRQDEVVEPIDLLESLHQNGYKIVKI